MYVCACGLTIATKTLKMSFVSEQNINETGFCIHYTISFYSTSCYLVFFLSYDVLRDLVFVHPVIVFFFTLGISSLSIISMNYNSFVSDFICMFV